jgi:hypothetical protein
MDLSVVLQITPHEEGISASVSHFSSQSDGALGDACWVDDDNHGWNTGMLFVGWFLLSLHDQSWAIVSNQMKMSISLVHFKCQIN